MTRPSLASVTSTFPLSVTLNEASLGFSSNWSARSSRVLLAMSLSYVASRSTLTPHGEPLLTGAEGDPLEGRRGVFLHGLAGLIPGHPADLDGADADAAVDLVVPPCQVENGADHNQQEKREQGYARDPAPAGVARPPALTLHRPWRLAVVASGGAGSTRLAYLFQVVAPPAIPTSATDPARSRWHTGANYRGSCSKLQPLRGKCFEFIPTGRNTTTKRRSYSWGSAKGDQETRRLAFTKGSITLCPSGPHRENPTKSGRFLAPPTRRQESKMWSATAAKARISDGFPAVGIGVLPMKATVQPVESPELEGKIGRLRILSFPDFPEVHEVVYYSALYRWYEDHPLSGKLYRWVSVTAEGEVVGHLTAFPQFYRIDGQRVIAHTPGDYMVLPQQGFQAIMLMRSFFRQTENCVVCDMVPAVIGVETRLGAGVVGDLKYWAKLMNVSRLPMPSVPAPLRRLFRLPETFAPARGFTDRPGAGPQEVEEHVAPPAPRPRAPIPRPVQKLLNRGLQKVDETLSRGFGRDLEVEEIDEFDDSFDDLFERIAAVVPCTAEKDGAFLRWRYGAGSPQAPVTVLAVRSGGRLLGYAVLKAAFHGQDGYVLDLTALPGRQDVVLALLRETVRSFSRMGVQIIRYRFVEAPTSPRSADLRRLGFFYRRGRRHKLLTKFADTSLRETTGDLLNWSLSFGDGEADFWLR